MQKWLTSVTRLQSAIPEDAGQAAPPPTVQGGSAREPHPGTPIWSPLKPIQGLLPPCQPQPDWVRVHASPAGVALQAPVPAAWRQRSSTSTRASHVSLTSCGATGWIENELHWRLDVVFNEDQSRNRKGYCAENLALLRKLAMNLAWLEPSKGSMRGKLKRAGWDNAFLTTMLSQFANYFMR